MKKMITLLAAAGLVLASLSIANGHNYWAYYKNHTVPADMTSIPQQYIDDGYLDCCGCHADPNFPGPDMGFCPEE